MPTVVATLANVTVPRWKRTSFAFAAVDILAPLGAGELPQAALALPIAFATPG